jgi:thioredoxin 1
MPTLTTQRLLLLFASASIVTTTLAFAQGATPMAPMPASGSQSMGMSRSAPMANDFQPFTPAAFKAAQDAGKVSLVFFHAPWCPVCRAQEPKIASRLSGAFSHVIPFRVDYDSNQMLRAQMNVARQSTVILYRGATEIGRLSYTSEDAAIDQLFGHAAMGGM